MVLGSQGEPLDIGRATRTIPAGIRRAVVARDIGCIHPGCTKPAAWCQAHHVKHWANGGPTALANLVLRCHQHHWIVHHDGWHITFREGIPHVIPPPLVDPRQQPRRNTTHDQPGLPSG
jgi:5-methylcytosine-specific restriction protein A